MAFSNGESGASVRTKLNASLAKTDLITVTTAVNLDPLATLVGLTDGDKGDITVTSSGASWTIDNDTIGLAELSATGTPSATTFLRGDNSWATAVGSDPTGVTGADAITNMMSLTQAEYNAIGTPDAATFYVIV